MQAELERRNAEIERLQRDLDGLRGDPGSM